MKSLLLKEYLQLELIEFPEPKPGPGEALIRVAACGICGSDVHGYDGTSGRRIPPIVMGHEAAGIVAATGVGRSGRRADQRRSLGLTCPIIIRVSNNTIEETPFIKGIYKIVSNNLYEI